LDDFSHILYMMGDDIGDILLREVAKVLWAQLRVGDIVMRLENADEFLVMLPNIDPERAVLVAQRLCDRITELSDGGKLGLETTASIGIALYPQHGTDFDSLYDSAAQAMGCSKKAGKNRCQLFGTEDLFTPLQG
ncbi:MAG: GGDEF domain-containing protein, partial [Angelakisella sp.]